MPPVHTGDDGKTNYLGKGRIPKYDLRIETLGTIDEADACCGVIRAICKDPKIKTIMAGVMTRLHIAMGEVSSSIEAVVKIPQLTEADINWLEGEITKLQKDVQVPNGFILAGDTNCSALINQARTVIRRAERRVAQLIKTKLIRPGSLLKFLNRLGTLCFHLQVWEIQSNGKNISLIRDQ